MVTRCGFFEMSHLWTIIATLAFNVSSRIPVRPTSIMADRLPSFSYDSMQVRQDSWQPVVLVDLAVRSPARNAARLDYLGASMRSAVCWIFAVNSAFLREKHVLLFASCQLHRTNFSVP